MLGVVKEPDVHRRRTASSKRLPRTWASATRFRGRTPVGVFLPDRTAREDNRARQCPTRYFSGGAGPRAAPRPCIELRFLYDGLPLRAPRNTLLQELPCLAKMAEKAGAEVIPMTYRHRRRAKRSEWAVEGPPPPRNWHLSRQGGGPIQPRHACGAGPQARGGLRSCCSRMRGQGKSFPKLSDKLGLADANQLGSRSSAPRTFTVLKGPRPHARRGRSPRRSIPTVRHPRRTCAITARAPMRWGLLQTLMTDGRTAPKGSDVSRGGGSSSSATPAGIRAARFRMAQRQATGVSGP